MQLSRDINNRNFDLKKSITEIYLNRWNWAFEARNRLVDQFEIPEFRNLYGKNDSKQCMVAVYGESGVGKTTCILKLLGVPEENGLFLHVSNILRGNKNKLGAGTSTAIVYKCRPDIEGEKFILKYGSLEEELNDSQMEDKLQEIREKVENGVFESNKPIIIFLPSKYCQLKKEKFSLEIIDLPGINSENIKEKSHLEVLIKEFICYADIVLLFVQAGKLNDLGEYSIPGFGKWYNFINKFILIITRSISQHSQKVELKKLFEVYNDYDCQKEKYITSLIDRIHNVLHEYGKDEVSLNKNNVFPLEYGNSWCELKKTDPDLWKKCSPIINSLIDDLFLSIENRSKSEQTILQFLNQQANFDKIINERISEYNSKINALTEELSNLNNEKNEKEKKKDLLNKILSQIEEDIESLDIKEKKLLEEFTLYSPPNLNDNCDKKKSTLDEYLVQNKDRLKESIRSIVSDFRKEKIYLDAEKIIRSINFNSYYWKAYAENPRARFGYIIDGPGSRWWDHKAAVKKCIKDLRKNINSIMRQNIRDTILKKKTKFEKNKEDTDLFVNTLKTEIKNLEDSIIEKNKSISDLEKEKSEYIIKSQNDKDRAKQFMEFFNTSFKNFVINRQNYINNNSMVFLKLVEIINLYQLSQKIKTIIKLR